MLEYNGQCAIWPEFDAYVYGWVSDEGAYVQRFESPRAGGRYHIEYGAWAELECHQGNLDLMKKVSWWLASQRRQHVEIPRITSALLSDLQTQPLLHPVERAGWLLWYLADQTKRIGQTFSLLASDDSLEHAKVGGFSTYNNNYYAFRFGALAASQSDSMEEIRELAQHLIEKQTLRVVDEHGNMRVRVTVAGFEELRQQPQAPAYDQAFVAMWLDDSVRELYDKGISHAIERAGYKPYLVPDDLSADKIDDAIIANIRQSKFVVADFTHGDDGHRGSVYYEAGFAEGLGLQVIRTCRSDLIAANSLAFDTRQHNHIGWDKENTNYAEFIQELTNRIIARVGRGPIQDNA